MNDEGLGAPRASSEASVAPFLGLRTGLLAQPCAYLASCAVAFFTETAAIAVTYLGGLVYFAVNLALVGRTEPPLVRAAYTTANALLLIMSTSFILASLDRLAILLAHHLGSDSRKEVTRVFSQGLVFMAAVYLCCMLPTLYFIKHFLLAVGVAEDSAQVCQYYLRRMAAVSLVEMGGGILRTFNISHGLERWVGFTSLLPISAGVCASYYFVAVRRLSLDGVLYSRLCFELLGLAVNLLVASRLTSTRLELSSWRETREGLAAFFCESLGFSIGTFLDSVGFELIVLFLAATNNHDQIFVFASSSSLTMLVFTFGASMGFVGRTRVNLLLGRGEAAVAKRLYDLIYFAGLLLGSVVGLTIFCGSWLLASVVVASQDPAYGELARLLRWYAAFAPIEVTLSFSLMGLKSINRVATVLVLNLLFMLACNAAVCSYLTRHTDQRALYFMLTLRGCHLALNLSSYTCATTANWLRALEPAPAAELVGREFRPLEHQS